MELQLQRFIELISREYNIDTNIIYKKFALLENQRIRVYLDIEIDDVLIEESIIAYHYYEDRINFNDVYYQVNEKIKDVIIKLRR